ncbi:hypothetical protein [Mesorhizobium tamadayense]|nr:hypothetical protein [Mesorhizobium tamadayense]
MPGTSTAAINLTGAKSGTNRFSAGGYQATVTVRCEQPSRERSGL